MSDLTLDMVLKAKKLLEEQPCEYFMGFLVDDAEAARKTWNETIDRLVKSNPDLTEILERYRQ